MEKTGTVLPCPKCGSGFLAWGKPFRSATTKLIVTVRAASQNCLLRDVRILCALEKMEQRGTEK